MEVMVLMAAIAKLVVIAHYMTLIAYFPDDLLTLADANRFSWNQFSNALLHYFAPENTNEIMKDTRNSVCNVSLRAL